MLSGIGPHEHLEKMHIPMRLNLPVGSNLQDHVMCVLEYLIQTPETIVGIPSKGTDKSASDLMQYLFYTKGTSLALYLVDYNHI